MDKSHCSDLVAEFFLRKHRGPRLRKSYNSGASIFILHSKRDIESTFFQNGKLIGIARIVVSYKEASNRSQDVRLEKLAYPGIRDFFAFFPGGIIVVHSGLHTLNVWRSKSNSEEIAKPELC